MSDCPIKDFSSLHGHSHFSTFDGLSTPEENILAAKAKGLRSIALTDHGSTHGHADHYLFGKKHGVRTIYGSEAYVIHSIKEWNVLKEKIALERKNKGKSEIEDREELNESDVGTTDAKLLRKKGHLVILARNREGLSNLYQLTYKAHRDGFYGKPRMDKDMLRAHAQGLIASSACMGGVVSTRCWDFKNGIASWDDVVREAREFDDIFGRGKFYLEIQLNEHEGQKFINKCLIKVSKETGIPLTVTTDFHYSQENEWAAREVLHLLMAKKTVASTGGKIDSEIKQLYIKSPEEMWRTYESYGKDHIDSSVIIEAFQNTLVMDSLVEDFEPDTKTHLPTLPYENPFKEMGQRAIDGLKKLGLANEEEYKKQLLYELGIIRDKGMSNYFLIVQTIVEQAKKTQLVGAGRGSSGGSLVCYALGITDLDPIKYGLMFERFMDPSRTDMADIDLDFEDVEDTKEMLRKLFGQDNVACLSTYGTFQIKGLMKDLSRIFDLDHNEINKINRKIESELRALYGAGEDKSSIVIKLEDVKRVSPSFNSFISQRPEIGSLIEKLYGRNRHVSRHASGVVIGDDLPAETSIFTSKGVVQTSFTEGIVNKNLSSMGFVKFDILSIATLKIIHHALKLISKKTGQSIEELRESIRPHNLDLNDMKVMKHVFWEGNTCGIFQFTGKGIRRLAQRVRPESFDDVSAIVSLYRPGPLASNMHEIFIKNKNNPDDVVYEHPILEDLLKKTRGALIYQEQLMRMCNRLGKMELKDVQRIRKNLLKKIKGRSEEFLKAENAELSEKFIKGFVENGFTEDRAKQWWNDTLSWGSYGFNSSHSYTYSVMTMQCAHLATYHPLEFYTAVITKGQSSEKTQYVSEIQQTGIKILPVDVNKSGLENTIEGAAIRLSLSSIEGVGESSTEKIVLRQPYKDFIDFLRNSGVGKTAIEPLIQVGAFNGIHSNMKELMAKYEAYCANPKLKLKKNEEEWNKIWNAPWEGGDYELYEKVFLENTFMGFSLVGTPFEILDRKRKIEELFDGSYPSYEETLQSESETIMLPVVVKELKERADKRGQMMAFLKFGVESGEEFDAPAFSTVWKHVGKNVKRGNVYVGTFNRKEEDPESLVLGTPGFAHRAEKAETFLVDVDSL